jgi:hypothetical protein
MPDVRHVIAECSRKVLRARRVVCFTRTCDRASDNVGTDQAKSTDSLIALAGANVAALYGTKISRGDSADADEISGKHATRWCVRLEGRKLMRKLILAVVATAALGSAALAQSPYPLRPDFPGARQQFDPADPAYLGVGNNRSAAMGLTAGGGQPSKEELAKHRAYVESLREQEGPQYKMPQ